MKYLVYVFTFLSTLNASEVYKVEIANDPFDPNWLVAIGTILVSLASLLAGFKYFFIEGIFKRHTELELSCSFISEYSNNNLLECSIKIINKGKKIEKFYNALLVISSIKDNINTNSCLILSDEQDGEIYTTLTQENIISENDVMVELHADTSYNIFKPIALDKNIKIFKVELWLLYEQSRIEQLEKGFDMETLNDQRFNSIERVFSIEKIKNS